MRLLLLRHGIAEDAGPDTGWHDELRRLTAEGVARMEGEGRGMAALAIRADAILTSPLIRCVQTAALVAAAIGGAPREDTRLRPGMNLDEVCLEAIADAANNEGLAKTRADAGCDPVSESGRCDPANGTRGGAACGFEADWRAMVRQIG